MNISRIRYWIRSTVKRVVVALVDLWALANRFSFPQKYPWKWKYEMLSENYERNTTDLFRKIIKPGMTVLDIGAHIGYFTRFFSKLTGPTGSVFAFEPDPDNFALLKKNTGYLPNVTIINAAVSDKKDVIDFYQIKNSTGCHTTIPTNAPAKKFSVNSISIDEFKQRLTPDVIKIDIEGGESNALRGMKDTLAKDGALFLVMEFNPEALSASGTTAASVVELLRSYGFQGFEIAAGGKRSKLSSDLQGMAMYHGKSEYANVLFEK